VCGERYCLHCIEEVQAEANYNHRPDVDARSTGLIAQNSIMENVEIRIVNHGTRLSTKRPTKGDIDTPNILIRPNRPMMSL
jgi:hypothetical protein